MFTLFKALALPFFLISILTFGVITLIKVDIFILKNNMSELSLTEIFQQVFLLFSVIIFYWSAIKVKSSHTLFILISAFFGCMFLRELDYYFDKISHGFWLYPTLVLALSAIFYSFKNSDNIASSASAFKNKQAYFNILIGLVIIMVFSRLFGSGSLWKDVMNDDYQHLYKTIMQEGLELFGYLFLFIGSCYQYLDVKRFLQKEQA
ncbi:hypothetical protein AADZ91_15310 [Colwelliaceae bacterium 6441]